MPPSPVSHRRRAWAAGLAALVHGALAYLLITAIIRPAPRPAPDSETILYLTPAPRPVPQPPAQTQARAPVTAPDIAAPPPRPNYSFTAPAPNNAPLFAAPRNDFSTLLQGCSPGKVMTAEQMTRCGFAVRVTPRTDPTRNPREKVRDEGYWASERTANRTPGRVPCVTAFSRPVGTSAEEQGVMVDTLCALGELSKAAGR